MKPQDYTGQSYDSWKQQAPPESKSDDHDFSPKALKNEHKPPLFIFMKHAINEAHPGNISRIERWVNNYCGIANTKDKVEIMEMFNNRVKELMK